MLDSLGLGEVFILALLALILFGPENLPRMAARLGRWVRSLTRTSRTFLTEWREEALAVQDAVSEVRKIRDELYAARADVAGTLYAARTDVDEALGDARAGVSGQIANITAPLLAPAGSTTPTDSRSSAPATSGGIRLAATETMAPARDSGVRPTSTGGDGAIKRTQAILDQLARKRAVTAPPLENRSPGPSPRGSGEADLTPGDLTPAPSPARRGEPDVAALRAQVAEMADQVAALRAELEALRAPAPALAGVE